MNGSQAQQERGVSSAPWLWLQILSRHREDLVAIVFCGHQSSGLSRISLQMRAYQSVAAISEGEKGRYFCCFFQCGTNWFLSTLRGLNTNQALLDCTAPSGSPSSRISRTRSLPSKIFSRNLSREHGRFFRGRPLLEDVDGIDHIEEFKRLVEFEKLHEKESAGSSTKPEFVHSCIGSLRGSREKIIYEEEDDGIAVAAGDQQQTPVGSVQASPSSSRSSSETPSLLAEILAEAENFEAVNVAPEAIVVDVLVVVADDRDSGKPVMDQGYLLGSPKNCDSTDSDLISAAEFVDKPLQVESWSVDNVSNLEVTCNPNGLGVCEGQTFLEGNSLTAGDEDVERSVASCSGAPVLREVYYFTFQAQKHSGPRGTWKRLKRITCDLQNSGCQIERKMTGKGKVSLSFNNSGKQPRRHSFTDSRDFVWDSRDLFGKRIKDEEEEVDDATPADMHPGAFLCGMPGQRNPFFQYDAGFLGNIPEQGYKRWSPKKTSKGTALARKVRGLGGSPKPITSLESCLRAQMADALISYRLKSEPDRVNPQMANALTSNRVSRPLYFPSTVDEEGVLEDAVDNGIPSSPNVRNVVDESSNSEPKQSALPKLPNLSKFLKEYAAKLSKSSKCERCTPSHSRARANDQKASSSTPSTMPSFETLLFSFGVGLGVFASGVHKLEVKRLNQLLEQSQAELENLKLELERRKSPLRTNRSESATGIVSKDQYSVRSYYGSEQQEDQMAELEAELEAELDQLTGGDSATMTSQYSAMDELDMDTSVVYGDLEPTGLPAGVEEDSDETPPGQPACLNNYAVSPRELTRLLHKLQTSRQDNLIADLEEDLEAALSKLQSREKELELWKDRVKRLTKVSFVSASTDEYLTSSIPAEGVATEVLTAPRSVDPLGSQECPPIPMQEHEATGIVSEEDPAGPGSHPSTGPVTQGGLKSSLHKQEPADMGREGFSDGSSEITARDCKPILDNAQIISQLIDSVHGLESYGDRAESVEMGSTTPSQGLFSSSVSISDILDETPERHRDRGNLMPRAKLVVPYPSRRTSYNSDVGNPVLIRNVLENDTPRVADVRYTESSSDMSEADYRTMEIPYSIKYIDSTTGTASEPGIPAEESPSYWVGQAGLTTPVEKARQQLFKSPQSAPAEWPGELSPTVSEKIARWEGLMDGETPGPATGSDWECQSRASELDDANVFSEENLVLEAEELLGRMLIKRIVEKSRLGSDSLVKKAQSALATLERDDGVAYHGDDTFMNERTDSEADFSEISDDHEKQQQTSFLDEAVREEKEFFRRLEIINKDRKSAEEKATIEIADAGGVAFDTVPELNAQLSPATQPSGITKALRKDVGEQQPADDLAKEHSVKQLVEPNISGREDWLSRGDARPETLRARSDYREDEVRSRRRS